jgi:hypothetical protein
MERYNFGENVRIKAILYDENGNRVSGAIVKAEIKKPNGVVEGPFDMMEDTNYAGVYFIELTPSILNLEGDYLARIFSDGYEDVFYEFLVKDFTEITGGGVGVYRLTVETREQGTGNVIPEVDVAVFNADGSVLIASGRSNVNGIVTFNLNPGDYLIRCAKSGVATFSDFLLTGFNSNQVVQVFGEMIVIPPPSLPSLVRIYGNLRDLNLSVRTAKIFFEVYRPPQFAGDSMIVLETVYANVDPKTGDFYVDIAKGVWVGVVCKEAGLSRTFRTPTDVDVVKLKTLIGG